MPSITDAQPGALTTTNLSYAEAIRAALRRALEEVPETIFYGEDVAKPGGVFGVTRGLFRDFPERVFDTPISETAILGSAVGAAMMGRRPIVEIMWVDFSLVAFDQIVNQMANVRYVSRGELSAPLVVRTQQGSMAGACAQHSQSLEAFFLHTPGIRVAMPWSAQDAYDILLTAVHTDDPVVVIENRNLYREPKQEVVIGGPVAALGGHRLRRQGSDITIVTWGIMTASVLAAAESLAAEGISAEVIETPWLNPFPEEAVLASVRRTGRLAVAHEANSTGGFGAEVIARVVEAGIPLRAPARRIATPDLRIAAAPSLLAASVPDAEAVRAAVAEIVAHRP